MSKPQYSQKFRKKWLQDREFKDWLLEIENNSSKARCKYCKTEINAKRFDLMTHSKSKKHISAVGVVSASKSIATYVKGSVASNAAQGSLSLFIAAHCSILSVDHLGLLCSKQFKTSEAALNLTLHRTKCTAIINSVLSPHFVTNLKESIRDNYYSILIDESTDISVNKFLGITIIYLDKKIGEVVSTYLSLVEIAACDAQTITDTIKQTLLNKGLPLSKLVGIGTDNASLMVGVNNGVYKKLKEDIPSLILVPCVCHSLQLGPFHTNTTVV